MGLASFLRHARPAASGACLLALLMTASVAAGAPTQAEVDQAQRAFDEGLALLQQKRYAEACPRLEESQRLDPGTGTKFRLAECYEGLGRLGTAWTLYAEVSTEAKAAGRADRDAQASQRALALRPRVPWITIEVPAEVASVPGVKVIRDGAPVPPADFGKPLAVDPGAHTIRVSAPKRGPWSQNVQSVEGGTITVAVPKLASGSGGGGLPGQQIAAIVVGVVGLGFVGGGIGLGLVAGSRWDDALAGCEGEVVTRCSDDAIAAGAEAEKLANASTVGFVVGGAAIIAAPILWFTTPSPAESGAARLRVLPMFGPEGAALHLVGSF